MKNIFIGLILPLSFVGCATVEPKLTEKTNPYNQTRSYKYEPIITASCKTPSRLNTFVTIGFLGGGGLDTLFVRYKNKGWVFLDSSFGLDMLIDGEVLKLKGTGLNDRNVVYGSTVEEEVYYHITKNIAEKLSKAKKVQFRATGSNGYVERCLYAEQLKFISKVIPTIGKN
tara:strand:+ start:802 stop:1314 length:513 start_codon:yes stop_codon:yes gene_type:complete